ITAFALPGQSAANIDTTAHTISVTVPEGVILDTAPAQLAVSPDATVAPGMDQTLDFTGPVTYTVTAQNGESQVWTVNTTILPPTDSDANDITAFALPGQNSSAIDATAHTITVNVTDGTALNVAPSEFTIPANATVDPDIAQTRDFSAPVTYTVTSQSGLPQLWTVNTTVAANEAPVANDDTASVGLGESVRIDALANDTDAETPNSELEISAIIGVQPDNAGSFTQEGREFVFTSSGDYVGEATFGYTITDVNPGNEASAIVTINIVQTEILVTGIVLSPTALTLDSNATGQLTATVSPGNATNPTVDWASSDATIATVSTTGEVTGVSQGSATITASSNDTSDVVVTADVTVNPASSGANDITTFELPGQNSSAIDEAANTVSVNVPDGTELNVVPATFTISTGAQIAPAIDAIQDFNGQVTYTITAENGDSQLWTINVTVSPPTGSGANDITAFELPLQIGALIDDVNHTVTVNVPDGTVLSNIAPSTLNVSPAAAVSPLISEVQDFNGPVQYTVTAENGTPQLWTVNTTVAANQPPVAVDDSAGLEVGETITIDVLGNDNDPDTPSSQLNITNIGVLSPAGFGRAVINGRLIDFTSNGPPGEPEIVTFDYTINDGNPGNDATATVTVNITLNEVLVTGITVAPSSLILDIDEIGQLSPTVSPANATNRGVDWSSNDVAVATVSATGEVTAVSEGSALITASSNDASNVSQTVNVTVSTPDILVNGITITPLNASIKVNEIQQLTSTILPVNATDQTISWASTNEAIATVDANGSVTGVGIGTVTISATANDGSGTAGTASITVSAADVDVTNIVLNPTDITLEVGTTRLLGIVVSPGNATDPTVTWLSSNEGVVSVDSNGRLTAVSRGPAIVSATANDGSGVVGTANITVDDAVIAVIGISVDPSSGTLKVGETIQLQSIIDPLDATDQRIAWGAANEAIASVDGNGLVTANGVGTTTISAQSNDGSGISGTATITVTPADVPLVGITITPNTALVLEGATQQLGLIFNPSNATNQDVSWSSDDSSTATVNQSGLVQGIKAGIATISVVSSENGSITATAQITVTAQNTAPVANDDPLTVGEGGTLNRPILINDTDVEGDDLIVDWVAGSSANIGQQIGGSDGGIFTISAGGALNFDTNGDFEALNDGESQTTTIDYRVTDGFLSSNTARVTVTVDGVSPANNAPSVNAGNDITITLPINTTNLSGSASDVDGSIASYQWTKVSGPAATIGSPNAAATNISALVQGTYVLRLTATDDDNATGSDTVTVTVNEAANNAPSVNAGNDITITLPTNTTNLSGSASDVDGSIASYQWTKVSGPAATIGSPNAAATNISGLVQGTYVFRLTATDDDLATGSDTVTVTVNDPPAPSASFSGPQNVNNSQPSVSGKVTISNGPMTFNFGMTSFGPESGTITLTIDGTPYLVTVPGGGSDNRVLTQSFPPGTYDYILALSGSGNYNGGVTAQLP
ncbi:Ig-like domain-containing protein, partial [Maribacter sp.]|nr:Ig-like domain-containing protein [Maribacter sp.]